MANKLVVLTIAGSDPSGGAGIQADLKTFNDFGVDGASVIAALTAQNIKRVAGVAPVAADFVRLQMATIFEETNVVSVKTGMMLTRETIEVVADELGKHGAINLCVDPVMKASAGGDLLAPDAVSTLIEKLFPLAFVVTPNTPEAEAITGVKIQDMDTMKKAAKEIGKLGPKNVVITGGHVAGDDVIDLLYTQGEFIELAHKRVDAKNDHGTGCKFSAAITANLALGKSVGEAVKEAGEYVCHILSKQ